MRKFDDIKNAILGKSYDLSIAYVSSVISKKINHERRGIKKPTNILSFALTKKSGELIICRKQVKKGTLGPLVIHGSLHLKGMRHGGKMDSMEKKFCRQFGFN